MQQSNSRNGPEERRSDFGTSFRIPLGTVRPAASHVTPSVLKGPLALRSASAREAAHRSREGGITSVVWTGAPYWLLSFTSSQAEKGTRCMESSMCSATRGPTPRNVR
jgi:hypothetical protein